MSEQTCSSCGSTDIQTIYYEGLANDRVCRNCKYTE